MDNNDNSLDDKLVRIDFKTQDTPIIDNGCIYKFDNNQKTSIFDYFRCFNDVPVGEWQPQRLIVFDGEKIKSSHVFDLDNNQIIKTNPDMIGFEYSRFKNVLCTHPKFEDCPEINVQFLKKWCKLRTYQRDFMYIAKDNKTNYGEHIMLLSDIVLDKNKVINNISSSEQIDWNKLQSVDYFDIFKKYNEMQLNGSLPSMDWFKNAEFYGVKRKSALMNGNLLEKFSPDVVDKLNKSALFNQIFNYLLRDVSPYKIIENLVEQNEKLLSELIEFHKYSTKPIIIKKDEENK